MQATGTIIFSGAWLRQADQLTSLFDPGLYLFGQAINIPKLIAVHLCWVAVLRSAIGLGVGSKNALSPIVVGKIQCYRSISFDIAFFTLCTFGIFNFFFILAGVLWFSSAMVYAISLRSRVVALSTLWLYKTCGGIRPVSRENLASRFRKQLEKITT